MTPEEQIRQVRLIRDTKGLTPNERAFCRLIVDRGGTLFATWKQNAEDMGVGKDAYYRARNGVLAKGVVVEQRGYKTTTRFSLVVQRLGQDVSTSRHSGKPEPKAVYISTPIGSARPDIDKAPCFCSNGEACDRCQVPLVAPLPSEPKTADPVAAEEEVRLCGCRTFERCRDCSGHFVPPSSLPEWKQKDLYERDMAKDGLNEYGEPLGLDY